MAKGKTKRDSQKIVSDASPLTANPFAGLAKLVPNPAPNPVTGPAPNPAPNPALSSEAKETEPVSTSTPPRVEVDHPLAGKLVVRRQKRGQGGKTVTCVDGLQTPPGAELVRRLKRELGCSGRADGSTLVAGTADHARVARWLEAAGATRVKLGN